MDNLDADRGRDLDEKPNANRDPISGAPGAHPIGTGVGAAGAGATGAVIGGAVGGPVGAVVGAAVGAVAGGLAGKGVAEAIDPTVEDAYWRENYSTRPYAQADRAYEYYHPAYRYGWESRMRNGTRQWDEVESDLERGWDKFKGESKLTWSEAKFAAKDAWNRIPSTDRDTARVSNPAVESSRAISGDVGNFGAANFSGPSGNTGVGGV